MTNTAVLEQSVPLADDATAAPVVALPLCRWPSVRQTAIPDLHAELDAILATVPPGREQATSEQPAPVLQLVPLSIRRLETADATHASPELVDTPTPTRASARRLDAPTYNLRIVPEPAPVDRSEAFAARPAPAQITPLAASPPRAAPADPHSISPTRALTWAFGLKIPVAAIEVGAALASGSLFLLADAVHLMADLGAFGGAALAVWLAARRRAKGSLRSGPSSAEIGASALNGVILLWAGCEIVMSAVQGMANPAPLATGLALVGVTARWAGNYAAWRILRRSDMSDINVNAVALHSRVEAIGSLGLIVAILVSSATGFMYADPLISIAIAAMVLRIGGTILHRAWRQARGDAAQLAPACGHTRAAMA